MFILTIYIKIERIYIRNKLLNNNNHIFSLKRRTMNLRNLNKNFCKFKF